MFDQVVDQRRVSPRRSGVQQCAAVLVPALDQPLQLLLGQTVDVLQVPLPGLLTCREGAKPWEVGQKEYGTLLSWWSGEAGVECGNPQSPTPSCTGRWLQ